MIYLIIFCYIPIILLGYYLRKYEKVIKKEPIKENLEDVGKYCNPCEEFYPDRLKIPLSTNNQGTISFHYTTNNIEIYNEIVNLDNRGKPLIKDIEISKLPSFNTSKSIKSLINSGLIFMDNLSYIESLRKSDLVQLSYYESIGIKMSYYFVWTFNLELRENWETIMKQDISNIFQYLPKRKEEYVNIMGYFKMCIRHGIYFREKYYAFIMNPSLENSKDKIQFIENFMKLYQDFSVWHQIYNDFINKLNYRETKKFKKYNILRDPTMYLDFKWNTSNSNNNSI